MLVLWRRHTKKCPNDRRDSRKCSCPIWLDWTVKGRRVRKPLGIRDWQAAQIRARELEATGDTSKVSIITVEKAVEAFEDEARGSVKPSTLRKYKHLLRELKSFCAARNIVSIRSITVVDMREFRSSWKLSARTSGKQLERLKRFFNFCVDNGDDWLEASPTRKLKPPKVMEADVTPFSEEEVAKILKSCGKRKTDKDAMTDARRVKLLAQFLLATGLRIGDAVMIRTDQIIKDKSGYSVVLRTAKTDSKVVCPIQPALAQELLAHAPHPFWTGHSKVDACTSLWRKVFAGVFAEAGVKGHLHQFRHTFAKRLLISGVPVGLVSVLLGHARVAITEKHYSGWIPERQAALTEAVRQSWTGTPTAHQENT